MPTDTHKFSSSFSNNDKTSSVGTLSYLENIFDSFHKRVHTMGYYCFLHLNIMMLSLSETFLQQYGVNLKRTCP